MTKENEIYALVLKRYNQYIKTMPSPIMPSDLPKRKINLSAIAKYAKDNNICIASLSDTEKEHLMETIVAE